MSQKIIYPQESRFSSTSPPLAQERALFLVENLPDILQLTHIDGSFPSFFADALRAAHPMLFPPRDLPFPKLFGTESPEDVTGEKYPFSVLALSVPSTHCKDSFVHNFLSLLSGFGLVWFWNLKSVSCLSWEVLGLQTCATKPVSSFTV